MIVLGIVGSFGLAEAWDATNARQRDGRLGRMAATRTATINDALRAYEDALHAERALFVAAPEVTRRDFAEFVGTLDLPSRYPGMGAIGWQVPVPDSRLGDFLGEVRRGGPAGFSISPAGRRPDYYVTVYNEPAGRLRRTWGVDVGANPAVREALDRARDSGQVVLSDRGGLADGGMTALNATFAVVLPVYRAGAPVVTVAQRRAAFMGWATSQFQASDFLNQALRSTSPFLSVELYDQTVGPASLLARSTPPVGVDPLQLRTESFQFGGRTLVLRYSPLPGSPTLTERTIPGPVVLAAGLLGSLLLGALLWLLALVSTLYQRVRLLARTDPLTGVANRRVWDQELPRELARASRYGDPVCVALIDLDYFKAYNDEHGHQGGDRLLKEIAAAWAETLRTSDLLARYGGEEFVVLLPVCSLEDAMVIAERLRTSLPAGTCSIGVAEWDFEESSDELIGRADRALYVAKAEGRDRCHADAHRAQSRQAS